MSSQIRPELSPIVRAITLQVIKTLHSRNLVVEKPPVINADIVPRVSRKIVERTLKKESVKPHNLKIPPKPVQKKPVIQQVHLRRIIPQKPIITPTRATPPTMPATEYGKIGSLLMDPTVSYIECPGPDKPLVIIRAGQKQFTKITLNAIEIKNLLETIAQKAHVPLMEGIFKAAVDNFMIHAVVSQLIGSRFVIKKQTPYSLLEQRQIKT